MDRSGIARAAKLLAKAVSTDSEAEAIALSLRAYSILADNLNAFEAATTPEPRRRERRRLRDRRAVSRAAEAAAAETVPVAAEDPVPDPAEGYTRILSAEQARGHRIDYPL